jgi:hypothetical protein
VRNHVWVPIAAATLILASAVLSAQPPGGTVARAQTAAGKRATAPPSPRFTPVATVKGLMLAMIDPASDVVFNAVSSTTTTGGVVEKAPKTDEEWAVVRNNALILLEGANLLMMPGRHIASDADGSPARPTSKEPQIELNPADIEVRVSRDRRGWIRRAQELGRSAAMALKAVEAKDPDKLLQAGDRIDTACENCHLRYWYPGQSPLLDEAVRRLRQRKP